MSILVLQKPWPAISHMPKIIQPLMFLFKPVLQLLMLLWFLCVKIPAPDVFIVQVSLMLQGFEFFGVSYCDINMVFYFSCTCSVDNFTIIYILSAMKKLRMNHARKVFDLRVVMEM